LSNFFQRAFFCLPDAILNVSAQLIQQLLGFHHTVISETVRAVKDILQLLRPAIVQCVKINALFLNELPGLVINRFVCAAHEAFYRIDGVLFEVKQLVVQVRQCFKEIGVILIEQLFNHGDGLGQSGHEGIRVDLRVVLP